MKTAEVGDYFGPLEVIKVNRLSLKCKCCVCSNIDNYNREEIESGKWTKCSNCKSDKGPFDIGNINKSGLKITDKFVYGNRGLVVRCVCSNGHTSVVTKDMFLNDCKCDRCVKLSKKLGTKSINSDLADKTSVKSDCNDVEVKDKGIKLISFDNISNVMDINKDELSDCLPIERVKTAEISVDFSREEKIKQGNNKKDTRYANRVINGLSIIDDDFGKTTREAVVKCVRCNNVFKTRLNKLIKCEVVCPLCADKIIKVKYGTGMSDSIMIKLSDAYKGGIISDHGKRYNLFTYGMISDAKYQLEENINKFDSELYGDLDSIDSSSGLMYSSTPAMIDRELKTWYNCYCSVHRKSICVRGDSLSNFSHKECLDVDNAPIALTK